MVEIVAGTIMKRFVEGESRTPVTLLPECLDGYVAEENPVRGVDVFADELDLGALGFEGVDPSETGRPAYHTSGVGSISTAISIGFSRAAGLSVRPSATLNLCGQRGDWLRTSKSLLTFAKTTAKPFAAYAASS